MIDTTIGNAAPGGKSAAARDRDIAAWLESVTGNRPTEGQLEKLKASPGLRVAATRGATPARTNFPPGRARTFAAAGYAVADAALVPHLSASLPGFTAIAGALEARHDTITRRAGALVAAYAAATYATGVCGGATAGLLPVAYMASVFGDGSREEIFEALARFGDCAACAAGPNWPIIEAAEARIHAGMAFTDLLREIVVSKATHDKSETTGLKSKSPDVYRLTLPHQRAIAGAYAAIVPAIFNAAERVAVKRGGRA